MTKLGNRKSCHVAGEMYAEIFILAFTLSPSGQIAHKLVHLINCNSTKSNEILVSKCIRPVFKPY